MPKKSNSLWEYLEASGVLEKGNDADIKAVKREYRKKYYLNYKRTIRKEKPEYTLSLSRKNGEYDRITNAAKQHRRTVTSFIRHATLAYIEQRFLVPNESQIAELEILLSNCLNEIKLLVDKRTNYLWGSERKLDSIEKRIIKLESDINDAFRNPKRLL
jgi:hypothetical protein